MNLISIVKRYGVSPVIDLILVLFWRAFPWPATRGKYAFKRIITYIDKRIKTLEYPTPMLTDVGWLVLNRRSDILQNQIFMIGKHYETHVVDYLKSRLQPGDTVFDIGAHVGYFTLLCAKMVGEVGVVYAFEPQSDLYSSLRSAVLLNGVNQVVLVNKAVTDRDGLITLYKTEDSGRSSLVGSLKRSDKIVEVGGVTLDEFCFGEKGILPSLIKMDIEGAEWLAVKGMRRLLKRRSPLEMLIEMHPGRISQLGGDQGDVVKELSSNGFSLFLLHHKQGLLPLPAELPQSSTWHLVAKR